MRIGLNLLHAMPEVGGVWNYISQLLGSLKILGPEYQFVAFVTDRSHALVENPPGFSVVRCGLDPRSRFQRVLFENTVLQYLAGKYRLDCMHWFANTQAVYNRVPGVVTVYDLHAFKNYSAYPFFKRIYLRNTMRLTARRQTLILPMSQATADDLVSCLKINPARMSVVRVILEAFFRPASTEVVEAFRAKYGLPEKFWLYVAHAYRHKNHARLLQAYRDLKNGKDIWPLVLRGDTLAETLRSQISELNLQSDVVFLPRLERSELPGLYSAATALVFPSLYEGGGIPVAEAAACGCPVAASALPSIREVIQDSALYFNPLDIKSIAAAMRKFMDDAELCERLRQKGLAHAEMCRAEYVLPVLADAYRRAAGF